MKEPSDDASDWDLNSDEEAEIDKMINDFENNEDAANYLSQELDKTSIDEFNKNIDASNCTTPPPSEFVQNLQVAFNKDPDHCIIEATPLKTSTNKCLSQNAAKISKPKSLFTDSSSEDEGVIADNKCDFQPKISDPNIFGVYFVDNKLKLKLSYHSLCCQKRNYCSNQCQCNKYCTINKDVFCLNNNNAVKVIDYYLNDSKNRQFSPIKLRAKEMLDKLVVRKVDLSEKEKKEIDNFTFHGIGSIENLTHLQLTIIHLHLLHKHQESNGYVRLMHLSVPDHLFIDQVIDQFAFEAMSIRKANAKLYGDSQTLLGNERFKIFTAFYSIELGESKQILPYAFLKSDDMLYVIGNIDVAQIIFTKKEAQFCLIRNLFGNIGTNDQDYCPQGAHKAIRLMWFNNPFQEFFPSMCPLFALCMYVKLCTSTFQVYLGKVNAYKLIFKQFNKLNTNKYVSFIKKEVAEGVIKMDDFE